MAKKKSGRTVGAKGKLASPATSALVAAGLRREKKRLLEIKRLADQLQRDRVRAERALRELANAVAEDAGFRLVGRGWLEELEGQNEKLAQRVDDLSKQAEPLEARELQKVAP
jgi:predicted transcriptional regulator